MGLNQNSSGFDGVWTLASSHALHLPTNTVQIFQVKLNFRLLGLSLRQDEVSSRRVHKLIFKMSNTYMNKRLIY